MILMFVLIFALAISFLLLNVFMKIALVLCSILLVAFIILLIVLSKKNLFRRFTSIGIIVSALYLIFMEI